MVLGVVLDIDELDEELVVVDDDADAGAAGRPLKRAVDSKVWQLELAAAGCGVGTGDARGLYVLVEPSGCG